MKTLVTGANGHLGSEITRQLVEQGRDVRAMVRTTSNIEGIKDLKGLEIVHGDLLDPATLDAALKDIEVVYQVAGVFKTRLKDESPMIASNVQGTINILEACHRQGNIRKILYTSSVAAIGCARNPETILDETTWNEDPIDTYVASKRDGERAAWEIQKKYDLPMVVLNPGTIMGAGDYGPTPSNDFALLYMKKAPPVYFANGHSYTDVEDVARGHLLAQEKGRTGERYILAGDNRDVLYFCRLCSKLTGAAPPKIKVGHLFVSVVGLGVEALAALTGKEPLFTRKKAHKLIDYYGYFSSAKAEKELGYKYRPLDQILGRSYAWFKLRGWLLP